MASTGFTVLEIVFIMLVASMLGALIQPLRTPGRSRLVAGTQALASTLDDARHRAIREGHDVAVTFTRTTGGVRVHADADGDGRVDPGESVQLEGLPESVRFGRGTLPSLIQPSTSPQDTAATITLVFHRNGTASGTEAVYLRWEQSSRVAGRESAQALAVDRASGRIHCYTFEDGSWQERC